jgi:pyridoxamine 5'-phosphate oxidase
MKKIQAHIQLLRNDYTSNVLDEKNVSKSPLIQFEKWLTDAVHADAFEPNAMTLATVSKGGIVDARIVLLRDFTSKGFSFFTNYNSIKGRAIRFNKKACMNFFWPELQRQVRIRGLMEKLPVRDSDQYFASRPRESQIAAWASHQSDKLSNRAELENRYIAYEKKFSGMDVPRPSHWGGYRLKPLYLEFWQGRPSRLHDRLIYERTKSGKWIIQRLNP